MQFLFTFRTLPVGLALLVGRYFKVENSYKGMVYAIANGCCPVSAVWHFLPPTEAAGIPL